MKNDRNNQRRGLKTFVPNDPRINRRGRPRGFDYFRKLAQKIAHETVVDSEGNRTSCVEALLKNWAQSEEPILQKAFIEYAFGRPPDKIEATGLENKTRLVLFYGHEKAQIERNRLLGNGGNCE